MTVAELIEFLKTQPQELQVAYRCYSDAVLLEDVDIRVSLRCSARPDGWVPSCRKDEPSEEYLLFPGN